MDSPRRDGFKVEHSAPTDEFTPLSIALARAGPRNDIFHCLEIV